jgi:Fic family protein
MEQFVSWINAKDELPVPIKAGIAHYQFATIHPTTTATDERRVC